MMSSMPQDIQIIGCRGKINSAEKFIEDARDHVSKFYSEGEILLQFLNADKILGQEHVHSAIEHAQRAFERNKNISSTMAMEILIYAAGEPQINNALTKIGLKDGCERIAMVADGKLDMEALLTHLNLKRDDKILEYKDFKLREFGISEKEISTIGKEKLKDLVLERVAMVDVRK